MRRLLCWALLLAACGPREHAAYRAQDGAFTLTAPAAWRVLENQGGAHRVSLFGPPDGAEPFAAAVVVYRYEAAGGLDQALRGYAARAALGALTPGRLEEKGGRWELAFDRRQPPLHGRGARQLRERHVFFAAPGGYFAVVLTAPTAVYPDVEPAFDGMLATFALAV